MSLQDIQPWTQLTSTGSSNAAYSFWVAASSDMRVYIGSSQQTTGSYTLLESSGVDAGGVDPDTGGIVQFSTAPSAGDVLTLYRETARKRTTDFSPGGNINIPTLNDQLDRVTAYQREDAHLDLLNIRMARYDSDQGSTGLQLPLTTDRAGKYLKFKSSDGSVTVSSGTVAGLTSTSVLSELGDISTVASSGNDIIVYEAASTEWQKRSFISTTLLSVTHSTGSALVGFDISTGSTGQIVTLTSTGVAWLVPNADNISSGTLGLAYGGLNADVSTYEGQIWISSGVSNELKSKFDGTTNPTSTNDTGEGYAIGSRWFDTVALIEYVCLDPSLSTAIWKQSVPTSTGGSGDVVGPSGALHNGIALFSSTTGKLIKDSTLLVEENSTDIFSLVHAGTTILSWDFTFSPPRVRFAAPPIQGLDT